MPTSENSGDNVVRVRTVKPSPQDFPAPRRIDPPKSWKERTPKSVQTVDIVAGAQREIRS